MNTRELISELKNRLNLDEDKAETLFDATIKAIENELLNDNPVALQGFGTFEVRKKEERISVNPTTQQRMLIPPKLTLAFKPSSVLKERVNEKKNSK